MTSQIKATYKIEKPKNKKYDIVDIGDKIAQEQSLGGYKWRFDKKFEKKDFCAEVDQYFGDQIIIRFPIDNISHRISHILNYLAGDLFGSKYVNKIKLIDIKFPKGLIDNFKGPQYGIDGIKKVINLNKKNDRPLAGMILKPSLGLNIEEIKNMVRWGCEAGIDIIKEDEKFVNPKYCNWRTRLEVINNLLKELNESRSNNLLYVFNVAGIEDEVLEYLRNNNIFEDKTLCLMTTPITTGYDSLTKLSKESDLPVYAHRAGHAAFTRTNHGISMKVLAKLFRLAGADFIHIGSVSGSHEKEREHIISNRAQLDNKYPPWDQIKSPVPVVSGGISPLNIEINIEKTTKERFNIDDTLFMVGSSIYAYPKDDKKEAIKDGVRAIREAIKAVKEGEDFNIKNIRTTNNSEYARLITWLKDESRKT